MDIRRYHSDVFTEKQSPQQSLRERIFCLSRSYCKANIDSSRESQTWQIELQSYRDPVHCNRALANIALPISSAIRFAYDRVEAVLMEKEPQSMKPMSHQPPWQLGVPRLARKTQSNPIPQSVFLSRRTRDWSGFLFLAVSLSQNGAIKNHKKNFGHSVEQQTMYSSHVEILRSLRISPKNRRRKQQKRSNHMRERRLHADESH